MSSQWSSQHPSTSHSRNRIDNTASYQISAQKYHTPYESRIAFSSSPPRSSSPPVTPYSIRYARNDALIRSSPEIGLDTFFHSVREHMDDPPSASGHRLSYGYPERAFTPSKPDYFSTHNYPPLLDFDASEYSEDVDHDIPEVDSEHTSDSAHGHDSVFFSDTEEENYGNNELSFGHGGYRTTFFRTSAERGQWDSHPLPFKSTPLPQTGSSASIPSTLPTSVLVDSMRTNSEPAPSTVIGLGFSVEPNQDHNIRGAQGPLPILSENVVENELQHEAESPLTMPSLTSDWESMLDVDVDSHERPSSPLPPSSPISYLASRSVSPASSPLMRSSSPLSEISSLDEEERHADKVKSLSIGHPDIEAEIRSLTAPTFDVDAEIKSEHALDDGPATTITPSLKTDSAPADFKSLEPLNNPPSSSAVTAPSPEHGTKHSSSIAGGKADIASEATDAVSPDLCLTGPMEDQSHLTGIANPKRRKLTKEIGGVSTPQMMLEKDNCETDAARRRRRKGNDHEDEHPTLKKRKMDVKSELLRPMTHNLAQGKAGVHAEKDEKNAIQQVSAKPKRRTKVEVSISCPASSMKRSRPLPKASRSRLTNLDSNVNDHSTPPSTQDPETVALNAQLCGMLIETMALSRASSLPLSSLYKMVMQSQPSLKLQRSEQEWLTVFAQVLQEGEAGHGSGVFGKVESSGKDDSNRPLEAQWFYVPEQDQDQERAALIRSMMPRPAKRTETKKYKQYYWRPLNKISKWDPEDEL